MDPALDPLLDNVPVVKKRKSLGGVALRRRLGAGKWGTAYLGRHLDLASNVVLKIVVPPPSVNSDAFAEVFLLTMRAAAGVEHRGLVRVIEVGVDAGYCYVTMDRLVGRPLADRRPSEGRLSEDEAVRIVLGAADALAAAHAKETIHLDVTPANIFVNERDEVTVTDLGLAMAFYAAQKFSSEAGDAPDSKIWPPFYMSPEQTRSAEGLAPPADVWSLGVILYQLVSGVLPWYNVQPERVVDGIRHGPLPDIQRRNVRSALRPRRTAAEDYLPRADARGGDLPGLRSDASEALCETLGRALRKDPSERHPDCGRLAADLRRHLDASGVRADAEGGGGGKDRVSRASQASADGMDAKDAVLPETCPPPPVRATDETVRGGTRPVESLRVVQDAERRRGGGKRALVLLGLLATGVAATMLVSAELRRREAARLDALEAEDRAAWREAKSEAVSGLASGNFRGALDAVDGFLASMATETLAPQAHALAEKIQTRMSEETSRRRREEREAFRKLREAERSAAELLTDAFEAREKGRLTEAREALLRARLILPGSPEVTAALEEVEILIMLAQVEAALGAGKPTVARQLYRGLPRKPGHLVDRFESLESELEFHEALARARGLVREGNREEAIAAIDAVRRLRPGFRLSFDRDWSEAPGAAEIAGLIAEAERRLGPMPTEVIDMGGGDVIEFVFVPPGRFLMGSASGEDCERPIHEVEITRGFYIGKHEVTKAQYGKVIPTRDPVGIFRGEHVPVESVSWDDAVAFCNELGGRLGRKLRLPTEAEWEYVCRAGSSDEFGFGDQAASLSDYGWYEANSGDRPHDVGKKSPNSLGAFDFHGNVWEWCLDWYGADYYGKDPHKDPQGPDTGGGRLIRGGAWSSRAKFCRSAARDSYPPQTKAIDVGFRLVMPIDDPGK